MKLVKNLKGLKPNVKYLTKNYEMFDLCPYNRGETDSIDVANVKKFHAKYERGEMEDVWYLATNLKGMGYDNQSKYVCLMERNINKSYEDRDLLTFMLDDYHKLNSGNMDDFMDVVTAINSGSKPWNSVTHFKSALIEMKPLAIAFQRLIDSLANKRLIDKRSLKPTKVMGLVCKNVKHLHGSLVVRKEYDNLKLLKKMSKTRFNTDLNYYIGINFLFKGKRETRIIHEVFFNLVWNENYDRVNLFHFLAKIGLSDFRKKKDITQKMSEFSNKKIRKGQSIIKIEKYV